MAVKSRTVLGKDFIKGRPKKAGKVTAKARNRDILEKCIAARQVMMKGPVRTGSVLQKPCEKQAKRIVNTTAAMAILAGKPDLCANLTV